MVNESFLHGRVIVKTGDLTDENVDAVVNASNSSLLGGGGVDGAIHARGGPSILAECRAIRSGRYPDGLPTGEAVITTGGLLPAKYVIHAVGPIYGENNGRDAQLLAACYDNWLRLAAEHHLNTIAFPAISTGVYGYPPMPAMRVASETITRYVSKHHLPREIRLVFLRDNVAMEYLSHHAFDNV